MQTEHQISTARQCGDGPLATPDFVQESKRGAFECASLFLSPRRINHWQKDSLIQSLMFITMAKQYDHQ